MGPPSARSARATFARNFFGVAGFRIVETLAFDTPEEAAQAAVDDGADVVVACSSDSTYPSLVPDLSAALDDAGSRALLYVAGNPDKIGADLGDSGAADGFVHLGSPLLDTLRSVQDRLGIDA
jgi:methylmalonyl-CoA mutase